MGWTEDTATAIAEMLEDGGISYRALEATTGRSYNYWWKRLSPSRETNLSLEDIETLCGILHEDPKALLARTLRPH